MEEELSNPSETNESAVSTAVKDKTQRPEVVTIRTWKEYLGESLLIIFSVLFALLLTEIINKRHERQHKLEIINTLSAELINNKKAEEEQYQYHLQVLKNIDSALANPAFQHQFINNGEIDLDIIAPHGVLYRDLNDVAWQVAKQDNIFSKINLSDYSLLTDIYDQQVRIVNSEQAIANVLLSRESRTAADNRITLILLRDNYHGWAVDRVPGLLMKYKKAIDALTKYSR
ncbi:MAG: hypothetical protein ABJA71_10530 [Ginsengibacter sp.]